jgi:hypothetical protein
LQELQDQFTGKYFPGGNALPQDVIRIHDAGHQFANVSPTGRGEAQQQIFDFAGGQALAEETGARGFANTPVMRFPTADYIGVDLERGIARAQREMEELPRGAMEGSVREAGVGFNDPRSFQMPQISTDEARELVRRGQEFYGQLAQPIREAVGMSEDRVADDFPFQAAEGAPERPIEANKGAAFAHRSPDLVIQGGYDAPGAFPYGPKEQFMNTPLHQMAREGDYGRYAVQALNDGGVFPEELGLPDKPAPQIQGGPYGRALGSSDMFDGDERLWRRLIDQIGQGRSNTPISAATGQPLPWDTSADFLADVPRNPVANDALLNAKIVDRVRGAVKTGFNATADLAGALPLFDPKFRQAVETGNVRKAGELVTQEYTTGLLVAPVVGVGAGALQRVAPGATAKVLPALAGAVRVGNPIAVVSQLGGDSAQPRVAGSYQGQPIREYWGSGSKPQYRVEKQGPGAAGSARLGRAILNGKPVFVPYGSVAGEKKVGAKRVGRPLWDLGQFFGR